MIVAVCISDGKDCFYHFVIEDINPQYCMNMVNEYLQAYKINRWFSEIYYCLFIL